MNDGTVKSYEKNSIKKEINKLSRTLMYCQILMILIALISFTYLFVNNYSTYADSSAKFEGLIYILSMAAGSLCFFHYFKYNPVYDMFASHKKMSVKKILIFTSFILTLQFVSQVFISMLENMLNLFGYSLLNTLDEVTDPSSTLVMFLYSSLIAPVIEELIFRGIIIKKLEKHGKLFAIVVSSVMFGMYHGNLYQGIFATLIGLLLGYAAVEYSVKYSILLHIINNMILVELYGLLNTININVGNTVCFLLFALSLILSIIIFIKKFKSFSEYFKENRTLNNIYKYTFTSVFFIIFSILNLFISFIGIEKL